MTELVTETEVTTPTPAKRTTADRLDALEQLTAETHELVKGIHAGVLQVAALADQAGSLVASGGIGSLLGSLGGDVGGAKGAILGALLKPRR